MPSGRWCAAALMEERVKNPNDGRTMGLTPEQVQKCAPTPRVGCGRPANYNSKARSLSPATSRWTRRPNWPVAGAAGAAPGGRLSPPLMEPARDGLSSETSHDQSSSRPVVANVTAEPVTEPEQIRDLLVRQVTAPVRWSQTMAWLTAAGVTRIYEIGPGKVLTGLAKREMRPKESFNIDTLADISTLSPATK
jgi:[acyl-carrier-protein] S-malonyltransferase